MSVNRQKTHGVAVIRKSKYILTARRRKDGAVQVTYDWRKLEREYMQSPYDDALAWWTHLNEEEKVNRCSERTLRIIRKWEGKKRDDLEKERIATQLAISASAKTQVIALHQNIIDELQRRLSTPNIEGLTQKELAAYYSMIRTEQGLASSFTSTKQHNILTKDEGLQAKKNEGIESFKEVINRASLPSFKMKDDEGDEDIVEAEVID